ncbi:MAG: DUF3667 domain-containing protein [Cytophagales bacterium]|nr:MAG: DUF3667 domain-containing protein [Cytophagales bacterium]TAF60077.1 MAG: DUF3667 domain-containing protein [Cytophagales bacterium]
MSRNRRKSEFCKNCQFELDTFYNYCPECGQENTDKRVPASLLIKDFVQNYINLDTRFMRSVLPLLFKPGFLTRAYAEGQRTKYIDPLRFYFVVSLLFFFLVNIVLESQVQKISESNALDVIVKAMAGIDSTQVDASVRVQPASSTNSFSLEKFLLLARQTDITDKQFLDTFKVSDADFLTQRFIKQARKVLRNDASIFVSGMIKNIPTAFTVFIPILALLLHIFYIRSRFFYVEHLVGLIHYQTFMFIMLMLLLLLILIHASLMYVIVVLAIICIYFILMLRNLYKESWFWCFFKGMSFLFLYSTIELILSVTVLLVTYLLF